MHPVIAVFPLQYVLLPGLPLPLHVFEPRYRQLIADVTTAGQNSAFGVVLGTSVARDTSPARRLGTGLSGVDRFVAEIGTMAEIVEHEPYPDGRCDLLTVGSRRFRIHAVDAVSRPYLQAEIEYLDETDGPVKPRQFARARALSNRYSQLLQSLTGTDASEDLAADPLRASYEIAVRLQLTTADRQELLGAETAADRLQAEIGLLHRELAILRATRAVPVPAEVLRVAASRN